MKLILSSGTIVELGTGMVWMCDNSVVARALNMLFSPLTDPEGVSVADGAPGSLQVRKAASALGGEVIPDPPRPDDDPPGTVY